jgi:hypothetical protein
MSSWMQKMEHHSQSHTWWYILVRLHFNGHTHIYIYIYIYTSNQCE